MTVTTFGYLILLGIDSNDFISPFCTQFQLQLNFEVRQKYSEHRIFNSLLDVWKWGQTQSFMFHIVLKLLCLFKWDRLHVSGQAYQKKRYKSKYSSFLDITYGYTYTISEILAQSHVWIKFRRPKASFHLVQDLFLDQINACNEGRIPYTPRMKEIT